jgi:hypothetical protein
LRLETKVESKVAKLNSVAFLAATLFLLFCFGSAKGQSPKTDEGNKQQRNAEVVIRFEQDWLRALNEHNRSTLGKILADDFLNSSWKGELRTKRQIIDQTNNQSTYGQKLTDMTVSFYGNAAIVRGLNIISDASGKIVLRLRFTDVLIYRHRKWQAVSAQETAIAER